MLDAFIIDAIRQAELEREREFERRRAFLELPIPYEPIPRREAPREDIDGGPIRIPFGPEAEDPEEDAA